MNATHETLEAPPTYAPAAAPEVFPSPDWNQTTRAYPQDRTVHELVESQARLQPESLAAVCGSHCLTYSQLNSQAGAWAVYLKSLGVGPGVLVGICMDRSLDLLVGLLAILKAGGAYLPLDPDYPKERLSFMLEDSGAPVLLTKRSLENGLPPRRSKMVCMDEPIPPRESSSIAEPGKAAFDQSPLERLAYVIYTSGSTGQPKGVAIEHRGLLNLIYAHRLVFGETCRDRVSQIASIAFDAAGFEIWPCLTVGASLHLAPEEVRASPSGLRDWLVNERITITFVTTPLAEQMLALPWPPETSLRSFRLAGSKMHHPPRRQVPFKVFNLYGPTETTVWTTWEQVAPNADPNFESPAPPIGRPISNTQLFILDKNQRPTPIGAPGELFIAGDGLARGYLNRPELTAEKFVPNPFSPTPGARMYRTGDSCRFLPDGNVEFLGRLDDQVKIRGYRIELGEIETVLAQHPKVREAAVMARQVEEKEHLVAYIAPKPLEISQDIEEATAEKVEQWRALHDEVIYQPPASAPSLDNAPNPQLNLSGWVSNYTGLPLSVEEMSEQVEQTVARIKALRPQKVLEIGCGAGLLLFRLAPGCKEYVGTDLSTAALQSVRAELPRLGLSCVQLRAQAADDFQGFTPGSFDLIILNSIVQYFPTLDYLEKVLQGSLRLLAPGGAVFVGDVRSYPLLSAFHASVQLFQAPSTLSLEKLRQRIAKHLAQEDELAVAPAYFAGLDTRSQSPQIERIEIQPKRGIHQNELSRYRYDVVLRTAASQQANPKAPPRIEQLDWTQDQLDAARLADRLRTHAGRSFALAVLNIPNARLREDLVTLRLLDGSHPFANAGELRAAIQASHADPGMDPEAIWGAAKEAGCEVKLDWSDGAPSGAFNALFHSPGADCPLDFPRPPAPAPQPDRPPGVPLANSPVQAVAARKLIPELRAHLEKRLPAYMIPSFFVALEKLPLTPNGKIDRARLPAPSMDRADLAAAHVAPRTDLERWLCALYEKILMLDGVGVEDDFFQSGGDSIQASLLINHLQEKLGEIVHVIAVFDAPTVGQLAAYLNKHYPNAEARLCEKPILSSPRPAQAPASSRKVGIAEVQQFRALVPGLAPRKATPGKPRKKNPSAIFILCPPRSGSTLFRALLAGHPDLFAPPELELLSFNTLQERRETHGGHNDFLLEGTLRALVALKGCTPEEARAIESEYERQGMTTQEFYAVLQSSLGNRRLVDKTPTYALDLETLRRAEEDFEDPLYLHLARHPYGMIRSFEEAKMDQVFFRAAHPFSRRELAELTWIVSVQNIQRFLADVPARRQLTVRFEDMVQNQIPGMERVCQFLGVDFRPEMLQPYQDKKTRMTDGLHPLARGLVDVKFHTHKEINAKVADLWKQAYAEDFLGETAWSLAQSLGYERSKPEGAALANS